MSGFLDSAFAEAHRRVESWRCDDLLGALHDAPVLCPRGVSFAAALRDSNPVALIAEIKRESPSRGVLCPDVDVASRARLYVEAGAAAVSVLTESRWFAGSIEDFITARRATQAPLLRKDFIVDEYDLEVSAAIGADAVLLIAARFDAVRLRELLAFAGGLGIEVLVETHSERDAAKACEAGGFHHRRQQPQPANATGGRAWRSGGLAKASSGSPRSAGERDQFTARRAGGHRGWGEGGAGRRGAHVFEQSGRDDPLAVVRCGAPEAGVQDGERFGLIRLWRPGSRFAVLRTLRMRRLQPASARMRWGLCCIRKAAGTARPTLPVRS